MDTRQIWKLAENIDIRLSSKHFFFNLRNAFFVDIKNIRSVKRGVKQCIQNSILTIGMSEIVRYR